ncbi:hypothetical protein J6590_054583 [Homalodisca vitripennis]|nr:hypothetical protein J6590_054583 [Homalodisca vitripennis]
MIGLTSAAEVAALGTTAIADPTTSRCQRQGGVANHDNETNVGKTSSEYQARRDCQWFCVVAPQSNPITLYVTSVCSVVNIALSLCHSSSFSLC